MENGGKIYFCIILSSVKQFLISLCFFLRALLKREVISSSHFVQFQTLTIWTPHLFWQFLDKSFKFLLYKSGFFFFLPWMQYFIYPIINNWLLTVIIMTKQEVTLSWGKKPKHQPNLCYTGCSQKKTKHLTNHPTTLSIHQEIAERIALELEPYHIVDIMGLPTFEDTLFFPKKKTLLCNCYVFYLW